MNGESYALDGVPVESLEHLVGFAREQWRRVYEVAGAPLVFEFQRVRHGSRILYDGSPQFYDAVRNNLRIHRTQEETAPDHLGATGYVPLSLVGTVLTFEDRQELMLGGGPSSLWVDWKSVDLATGKPPEPLTLFVESSLVDAMKADRCFGAGLTASEKVALTRFDELVAAVRASHSLPDNCWNGADAFSRIAVVGHDPGRNEVIVRFGFPYEIGAGATKTSYFGMRLRPTPAFRRALDEARKGHGFFVGDAASW